MHEPVRILSNTMKFLKIGVIAIVVAALLFAAQQSGILTLLTDVEGLQSWIAEFGPVGYLVFALLFIFACVFMLPGSALDDCRGYCFWSGCRRPAGTAFRHPGRHDGIYRRTIPAAECDTEKVW